MWDSVIYIQQCSWNCQYLTLVECSGNCIPHIASLQVNPCLTASSSIITSSGTLVLKNTSSKKTFVSLCSHSLFIWRSQSDVSGIGLLLGEPNKNVEWCGCLSVWYIEQKRHHCIMQLCAGLSSRHKGREEKSNTLTHTPLGIYSLYKCMNQRLPPSLLL